MNTKPITNQSITYKENKKMTSLQQSLLDIQLETITEKLDQVIDASGTIAHWTNQLISDAHSLQTLSKLSFKISTQEYLKEIVPKYGNISNFEADLKIMFKAFIQLNKLHPHKNNPYTIFTTNNKMLNGLKVDSNGHYEISVEIELLPETY